MPAEGKDTPKICLGYPAADDAGMRRVKQIGVDNVLMGGPRIPWEEADIRGRHRKVQGRRSDDLQPDDLGVQRRHLGPAEGRRADRERHQVDPRRRQGRVAGHRIQLLRASPHGRLQRGTRQGRRRLHGVRLRAVEESPAARGCRHAHSRRPAETRRALPEGDRPGGRESERAAGASPERSAGAAQPRLRAADGAPSHTGSSTWTSSRARTTA